jgi:hypothetical protein
VFVNDFFLHTKYLGRSWQNFAKILIYAERLGLSRFSGIQQPGHFLIAVNRKPLTIWSHEMNYQNAERVTYRVGIQKSMSFRFA